MPNIWRFCKELEDLELSFNNFDKGHMPADIGNLIKLQSLYLTSINLEGKILLPTYCLFIISLKLLTFTVKEVEGLQVFI
jgi:hypothetical protein